MNIKNPLHWLIFLTAVHSIGEKSGNEDLEQVKITTSCWEVPVSVKKKINPS